MTSEKPPTIAPARTSVTGVGRPAPTTTTPVPGNAAADGRPTSAGADREAGSPPPRPFPASGNAPDPVAAPASGGPRKVRLVLSKVDPWSVMKLSFLISVAAGIMLVVATAIIWKALDSAAVFTSVNDTIAVLAGRTDFFDLLEYVAFDRVISLATMIGVADIVILTLLGTIGAFLYNVVASLVGGVHVTLTDD